MDKLTDKARELRNAYQQAWRIKNPDSMKQYVVNYWEKKAAGYTVIQKARDLSLQGFTQREIAEQLGVSLGTVNSYLNDR